MNEFVAPLMRSLPQDSPLFRSFKDNTVKKAINERISELHPYLQDNDRNVFDEDNFLLEGNDETAIIEFLPKTDMTNNDTNYNLLKNNIKKYKKIREKIKKSLTDESVSEKTKTFVLKTLDDLSKDLIHGRCSGQSMRSQKNSEPYLIANKWNEGWRHIKNSIFSFLSSNFRKSSDIPKYIDNLHMLLKKISKDADLISKKYKIQCEFIPKISYLSTESSNPLRLNWDSTDLEEDRCQRTIICSNELKDFMFKFYQTLNDTTVSVLKNYEEMYTREVSADDAREKQTIIHLLARASDDVKTAVKDVYLKEIRKFKLHESKNHEANINLITEFIKKNVENVKEKIRKMLRARLSNIRDKVALVIQDDVKVNLDVDLGNLEQEFTKRICAAFRLCNGQYAGRRQNEEPKIDKNNVLVQVQLSLDSDPEFRRFLNNGTDDKSATVTTYSSNVNITRTTTFSSTMQN
ncbi:unnamed protein product [Danaus chrysippus]|uniref:(African queen) hypothetical protein n=1 Tax=Danaus chrysippus TaxID=151541 RepID=A0A8J2W064_9NEOP|nr:unnamed protein product [Danaus chrysippus]